MNFPIRSATAAALILFSLSIAYPEETGQTPKAITYLGVSTFHLSPSLREHLEIEDGFGVQIHEVVTDSPADKAGLKKNDILLKFKEQVLISPEHLSLLVRRENSSAVVTLTLIRKGAEEVVEVTLGEIESTDPGIRPRLDSHRMSPEKWQEHLKSQQDYWEKWMNKRQSLRDAESPDSTGETEQEVLPGRPPAISVNPGFPVRVFGSGGVVKIDNEQGEVSITNDGGSHEIAIKNADGEEVYSGPYDAELGVESLPAEAQEHLKIMKLDNLKMLVPQIMEDAPEKTSSPMPPETDSPEEEML